MACPTSRSPARVPEKIAPQVIFDSAASAGLVCCAKTYFPGPQNQGSYR
jgi:hypothetical protein